MAEISNFFKNQDLKSECASDCLSQCLAPIAETPLSLHREEAFNARFLIISRQPS